MDLLDLNENQRSAVMWESGALLVLAGPGSGKTRVLTQRIARLVLESPQAHFRILGLTFTNKAAAEMRERVTSVVPDSGSRVRMATFHSYAADLLRQHGHIIGLSPDFVLLTHRADRESVLDEAIRAAKLTDRPRSEQILPFVNRLLEKGIRPENAIDFLRREEMKSAPALQKIYGLYIELMKQSNRVDFPMLLNEATTLLESNNAVRKQQHTIYKYVCVDEFQDTNEVQYRLLRLIVAAESNLFVVADDDQIIYEWNGASPARLKRLREDFNMAVMQLPENYRCPPSVVGIANRLIEHNADRPADKARLQSIPRNVEAPETIRALQFESLTREAEWVADDILARGKNAQVDCVIIARTRKVLDVCVAALGEKGIPAYVAARKDEFTSPQFVWLHSILRLANSRQDKEQLRRVCRSFFVLEGINLDFKDVVASAVQFEGDFLRAWTHSALVRLGQKNHSADFLSSAMPRLSDRLELWPFIDAALQWHTDLANIPERSRDFDLTEVAEERKALDQLVHEITFEYGRDAVTLNLFLQELDLRSKTPAPSIDAVQCFTVHTAKGLEFKHVYLVGLAEETLPSWAAVGKGDQSAEMEEERRNCFVAITRTQESLTLTCATSMFGWEKKPSRFLSEMGLDLLAI